LQEIKRMQFKFGKLSGTLALAGLIVLAGCSGSGEQGPQGPPGEPGAPGAPGQASLTPETCTLCHNSGDVADPVPAHDLRAENALAKGAITVQSITVPPTGPVRPVVRILLTDAAGVPVTGYPRFRFTIAKLVPGGASEPDEWTSYVNGSSAPTTEASYGTSGAVGSITEIGAGVYEYTFSTDLSAVTTPIAVPYEPTLVHRVGVQTAESTLPSDATRFIAANGVGDFTPSTGVLGAQLARDIATTESCNKCHGKLSIHGRRMEVAYCVTCHNKGAGDEIDMTKMIHAIHAAAVRTTGYELGGHAYGEVTYPQDVRNCATCHTGADGDNWNTRPSEHACLSCHDDISLDDPPPAGKVLHSGGSRTTASNCVGCHHADGRDIVASHAIFAEQEAKRFEYEILSVTDPDGGAIGPGEFPKVTFKVVDPTNGDAPYNILPVGEVPASPYFTQGGGASSLSLLLAWSNADFTNAGSGSTSPGQVVSLNALSGATAAVPGPNPGEWVVTSNVAIPADATGSGTVAIQGHPALVDPLGPPGAAATRIPAPNASKAFLITGRSLSSRRAIVSMAKCNECHFNLSLHGNNRTGDVTTCVMCHNGEATDIARRPADPATTPDGKAEESIDMKTMIHAIHAPAMRGEGVVVYGFGSSVHDFGEVTYPGVLSDCQACHLPGTYGLTDAVNGVTTGTGADRTALADNTRTTKHYATCGSCHKDALTDAHMVQNGGAVGLTQAEIDALQ
jgi:OmcA/MtrC family decaheme c-type cytochrome